MIFAFSYELAFELRFDFAIPEAYRRLFWATLPWVLPLQLAIFCRFGNLDGWWRYVTFPDLAALVRVTVVATLAISCVDYLFIPHYQIPRAVVLLNWGISLVALGGLRSAWRLLREDVLPKFARGKRRPALMVGAGQQGEALARQIHANPRVDYQIVGFLDRNRSHHGSRLGGIPFLASPEDAPAVARSYKVEDVLVIAGSVSGKCLRDLVGSCREAGVGLKMIPPITELVNGSYPFQVRDVDVNDLLRREPVILGSEPVGQMLRQKRVMVTGAGGSIGSEICRQLLKHDLASLVLVERAENQLFYIERELGKAGSNGALAACVGDVCDQDRLHALFRKHQPHILFHAAAHKHVSLMEGNPGEAIKNNVVGTAQLADMADEYGLEQFVLISTDKAVNPASVMGATKQLAERYIHALSRMSRTKYVVVRFGNVLGSSGSVVPLFQEQIRDGGPVTVTDAEVNRFFMTIPEAAQLVIEAAALGEGGEIFVLDMGRPVKIMDLARDLIRLSGFTSDDIEIKVTGLRPGEKLTEELYLEDEQLCRTSHPKLHVIRREPYPLSEVREAILELQECVNEPEETVREKLRAAVKEYVPFRPVGASEGAVVLQTMTSEYGASGAITADVEQLQKISSDQSGPG
jgi:FlaA1/EpsC-like NDP-sugar epimerase